MIVLLFPARKMAILLLGLIPKGFKAFIWTKKNGRWCFHGEPPFIVTPLSIHVDPSLAFCEREGEAAIRCSKVYCDDSHIR